MKRRVSVLGHGEVPGGSAVAWRRVLSCLGEPVWTVVRWPGPDRGAGGGERRDAEHGDSKKMSLGGKQRVAV